MARLKQARDEAKAEKLEQSKAVEALIVAMSPDFHDELVSMAKTGHWVQATHKIEKERQVDLTITVLAMKVVAPLE